MKRVVHIGAIAIFMSMLLLPYLFAHRDPQERVSYTENRMLAAYPSGQDKEGGWDSAYLSRWEDWLEDNIRGRNALVSANARIQYSLFHRIVRPDILQGRNGWLFNRSDDSIREFQRGNVLPEEELDRFADRLQHMADYLQRRGATLYYFQCFAKESIYPEQYADGIVQAEGPGRADQIMAAIAEKTTVEQVLVKDILLAHKDEILYYRYADSVHWNATGAQMGYQACMEKIRERYPQAKILEDRDLEITEEEISIDLYGLVYPYSEICPYYNIRAPRAQSVAETEESREKWAFLEYPEHTREYVNESGGNDLKILFFCDSFVRMGLLGEFAEGFSHTLSVDWNNIASFERIVEEYGPDIVIIEDTEFNLPHVIELIREVKLP